MIATALATFFVLCPAIQKDEKKPEVLIEFATPTTKIPKEYVKLVLEPSGDFRTNLGRILERKNENVYLKAEKAIYILVENAQDVSFHTLSSTLKRLQEVVEWEHPVRIIIRGNPRPDFPPR